MRKLLVSDVMTREPIIVSPDATLFDCAKKIVRNRVSSVLIVEKKRLVGLISQKDIMWAIVKKSKLDLPKIRAIDISPKKLATTKPDAPLEEAWSKMKKLKFERLPVIHNGELVGIVTHRDIINFNPNLYNELREFEQIKEESDKLKRIKRKEIDPTRDGICEECGHVGALYRQDGMLLCSSCRDMM